jgi:hypothetical protein
VDDVPFLLSSFPYELSATATDNDKMGKKEETDEQHH